MIHHYAALISFSKQNFLHTWYLPLKIFTFEKRIKNRISYHHQKSKSLDYKNYYSKVFFLRIKVNEECTLYTFITTKKVVLRPGKNKVFTVFSDGKCEQMMCVADNRKKKMRWLGYQQLIKKNNHHTININSIKLEPT